MTERTRSRKGLTRIGLDIGATAVRAVQLDSNGRAWTVRHVAEVRRTAPTTPEPAKREKDAAGPASPRPASEIKPLTACIAACLDQAPFKGRRVAVGLTSPDVELLTLEIPPRGNQSVEDYDQIARVEIQRLATMNQGPLEMAWWTLPRGTGRSPTAIGVAAPADLVRETAEICHEVGADCEAVDASACALVRTALAVCGPRDGHVWGLLDLGGRQSRLAVSLGPVPVLVRTLGEGGRGWTSRLAEELRISDTAAEVHKCDVGIEPSLRGVRRAENSGPSLEHPDGHARKELGGILFGALRTSLGRLLTEIERSYSYVLSCYPTAKPLDLVLAGGGASMYGLREHLGDALGIPVRALSDAVAEESCGLRAGAGTRASGGAEGSPSHGILGSGFNAYATAVGLALEGGSA